MLHITASAMQVWTSIISRGWLLLDPLCPSDSLSGGLIPGGEGAPFDLGTPKGRLLDTDGLPCTTRMMSSLWRGAQWLLCMNEALSPSQLRIQGRVLLHRSEMLTDPRSHTVEEIGPKSNPSLPFICRCQHKELWGGWMCVCSVWGPWQSIRSGPLTLFHFLFGILFSIVPYRAGDFRLPLLSRTLHCHYQLQSRGVPHNRTFYNEGNILSAGSKMAATATCGQCDWETEFLILFNFNEFILKLPHVASG